VTERARQHEPPYRLLIVDDSPLYRLRFTKLFGRNRDLTVVGVAADGDEALRLMASGRPDVVVLDLTMPRMDGFVFLRSVMAHAPLPVVVCSSRSDRESVFKALELGAVDYIVKPSAKDEISRLEPILVERVRSAAEARLGVRAVAPVVPFALPPSRHRAEVIAIAASTGGPAAIQRLVHQLPRELTVPIVVVQHMPPGFTRLFAERLERQSHYRAAEAYDGAALEPCTIAVAPGGMQTRLATAPGEPRLEIAPRAAADVYAPSADLLFSSMADAYGPAAVCVVLTGMGDDGSRGAVRVKECGGYVLAETSDSALIFGMPRAAIDTGCADAQLPLDRMAEAFVALAS
jgi:two-component system chemotaxis response regulator CheB